MQDFATLVFMGSTFSLIGIIAAFIHTKFKEQDLINEIKILNSKINNETKRINVLTRSFEQHVISNNAHETVTVNNVKIDELGNPNYAHRPQPNIDGLIYEKNRQNS